MSIRLGIVGCGEVVVQGHAPALREQRELRVEALCDPSPGRVEAARAALGDEGIPGFSGHRELLAGQELDAVLLATPSHLREEIVDDVVAAGCFLLCEKPLALTLAAADRIVQRCASGGTGLAVCHSWAYFPEFTTVDDLIADGAVGDVHTVTVQALSANPWAGAATYRPGWRDDPAISGGGRFMDTGIHTLYLMERFLGTEAVSVSAEVRFDEPGAGVESHCFSRYRFPAGTGVVSIGRGQGPASLDVVGTRGRIHLDYRPEIGDLGYGPERVMVVRDGEVRAAHPAPARGMFTGAFYDAVAGRVRDPGAPSPLSGEQGRRAVELVLAAYASAHRQRDVALPLDPDDPVYRQGIAALSQPARPRR